MQFADFLKYAMEQAGVSKSLLLRQKKNPVTAMVTGFFLTLPMGLRRK